MNLKKYLFFVPLAVLSFSIGSGLTGTSPSLAFAKAKSVLSRSQDSTIDTDSSFYNQSLSCVCESNGKKVGHSYGSVNISRCHNAQSGTTDLFLTQIELWFVPGIVDHKNDASFDGGWHHSSCTLEVKANPYFGNEVAYKLAAPQNSTFENVTISSGFSAGITYGRAEDTTISLDGLSLSETSTATGSFSVNYEKTYSSTQPLMNAYPRSGTNATDFIWDFSFDKNSDKKDSVFHVSTTYLFEVKRNGQEPVFDMTITSTMKEHGFWTWDTITSSSALTPTFYI